MIVSPGVAFESGPSAGFLVAAQCKFLPDRPVAQMTAGVYGTDIRRCVPDRQKWVGYVQFKLSEGEAKLSSGLRLLGVSVVRMKPPFTWT